jgi:uncharacterized protein YdhG (YjbR/CyaY superfamily)
MASKVGMYSCGINCAKEVLKWGLHVHSYQEILGAFAAFKNHIGCYPMPSAIGAFVNNLTKSTTDQVSARLPLDRPILLPLIRKVTLFRLEEN